MLHKAIAEMMDVLRGESDNVLQSFETAASALAWCYLSTEEKIPADIRFKAESDTENKKRFILFAQEYIDVDLSKHHKLPAGIWYVLRHLQNNEVINQLDFRDLAIWYPNPGLGSLPTAVADVMIELAGLKKNSRVYCPWDETGQLSSRVMTYTSIPVYIDIRNQHHPLLKINSLMVKNAPEVALADPIREPTALYKGKLTKFDISIASPPMGMKYRPTDIKADYFGRFPDKGNASTVLFTRHLLAQSKDRVVVLLPTAVLFSSGSEASMRNDLVSMGVVKTVITLPAGDPGFKHRANTCILVLDPQGGNKSIRFIDASAISIEEIADQIPKIIKAKKDSSNRITVSTEEVMQNDSDLQVSRYLLSEDQKHIYKKLASSNTVHLAEVCQMIAPVAFPKDENSVPILTMDMSRFTDHGFVEAPIKSMDTATTVTRRAELFLQPNDIMVATKGTVGRVGIVPETVPPAGEDGWFPPRFAIILRCNKDSPIDSRVLYLQLRSKFGQQLLTDLTVGATIPIIRLADLKKMRIIIPPAREANKAIKAFDQEVKIQNEIEALRIKQKAFTEKLFDFS